MGAGAVGAGAVGAGAGAVGAGAESAGTSTDGVGGCNTGAGMGTAVEAGTMGASGVGVLCGNLTWTASITSETTGSTTSATGG